MSSSIGAPRCFLRGSSMLPAAVRFCTSSGVMSYAASLSGQSTGAHGACWNCKVDFDSSCWFCGLSLEDVIGNIGRIPEGGPPVALNVEEDNGVGVGTRLGRRSEEALYPVAGCERRCETGSSIGRWLPSAEIHLRLNSHRDSCCGSRLTEVMDRMPKQCRSTASSMGST